MKYLKTAISFTAIIIGMLTLSAYKGGSNGYGGSSLPPCSEYYEDKIRDTFFNNVDLRYDFSTVPIHQVIVPEFSIYHSEIFGPTGSIKRLQTILELSDMIPDTTRRPECKMTFTSADCTGEITKNFKPSEISGNMIYNIPAFGVHLSSIKASIRSYKSEFSNIQLCWDVLVNVTDFTDLVIDADSEVSCDCCWDGYLKSGINEDYIAVRRIAQMNGQDFYEVIENTGYSEITSEGFNFKISIEKPVISPNLDIPICSEGEDELIWEEPIILINNPE